MPSSKRHPCPICDRSEDGDCRLSADLVLCYRGKHRQPPAGLKRSDVVTGKDRQQWAYTGDTSDGKWAQFTPDKPRTGAGSGAPQQRRVEVLQFARLPRPGDVPPAALPDGYRLTYSPSQWVTVRRSSTGKKFIPAHRAADGTIATGAGPEPWPLWQQAEAVDRGRNRWILEAEGEKCAQWIAAGGLVAISQPGHSHTLDAIADRYGALVAAGVAGVVYLADNDREGQRKAEACAAAARAVGLPFLIVPAAEVWPGLPEKGSIDDAPGTATDRVEQLAAYVRSHRHELEQAESVAGFPDQPDDDSSSTASTAAADLPRVEPSHGKAVRLAPDQVLQLLPQRVGRLRLNVRTREVHTDAAGVLSGNAIGRLYLNLSSRAEVWPKDATVDAVAELAHRDQFDPVAEYLEGITAEPLPVDQWQRLDRWLLGIDDPIAADFLPRYLISAVARVFEPGCEARQLPVLIGPQWRGKTALGRVLFGGDQWIDGLEDLGRDALMRAQTAWGVELSELDGITRRSDQEKLKTSISAREDTFRAPYERAPERRERRFVFWGTSNAPPLRDATGSSRFVCIPIPDRMLPLDWAAENRDALWARAVEQYRAGVAWDRCSEEERQSIADRNDNFREVDPWADFVGALLAERRIAGLLPVQVPEVLDRLSVPKERQTNALAARVRQIAEACGWQLTRRTVAGTKARGLWPAEAAEPSGHTPGHTGHTEDTPRYVRADASQGKGSQRPDTPDIPTSKEFHSREGQQQHTSRPEAPPRESGASVGVSVCPVCPEPETPTTASDLPGHTEPESVCPEVCPVCPEAPEPPINPPAAHPRRMAADPAEPPADLAAQLVSLRNRNPRAHVSRLAAMLDPDGRLGIDGRRVASWEEWIRQQPDELDLEEVAA